MEQATKIGLQADKELAVQQACAYLSKQSLMTFKADKKNQFHMPTINLVKQEQALIPYSAIPDLELLEEDLAEISRKFKPELRHSRKEKPELRSKYGASSTCGNLD